jgi:cobyrinic acid a,c-diamide synthase
LRETCLSLQQGAKTELRGLKDEVQFLEDIGSKGYQTTRVAQVSIIVQRANKIRVCEFTMSSAHRTPNRREILDKIVKASKI